MNLRTPSGTVLIGIVGLLALTALGWFLLISPITGDVGETHEAVHVAQDRNTFLTTQVRDLTRQRTELPAVGDLAGDLEEIFPATADQPGFFAAVNSAARAAGIPADRVTTLSPTAPQLLDAAGVPITPAVAGSTSEADTDANAAAVAEQTVAITVEGDQAQVEALLRNLETMPRAFLVETLEVARNDGTELGGGPSSLTVTISGTTYVAPPLVYPGSRGDNVADTTP